jgi:hypothetical protein
MQLHIIADSEGNILATARPSGRASGGPTMGSLIAGPGQTVHVVEVPDDLAQLDATLLHWRYRLEVRGMIAQLRELSHPPAKP